MLLIRSDRTLQHQPAILFSVRPRKRIAPVPRLFLNDLPRHLGRASKPSPLQLKQHGRLASSRAAADRHQLRSCHPNLTTTDSSPRSTHPPSKPAADNPSRCKPPQSSPPL